MKTILIIDDDPIICMALSTRLNALGYRVLTAWDGVEGYDLLARETPDLLILDINMPYVGGVEFVASAEHTLKEKNVPIILISGQQTDLLKAKAAELGAAAFLAKPYKAKDLEKIIANLFALQLQC